MLVLRIHHSMPISNSIAIHTATVVIFGVISTWLHLLNDGMRCVCNKILEYLLEIRLQVDMMSLAVEDIVYCNNNYLQFYIIYYLSLDYQNRLRMLFYASVDFLEDHMISW